MFSQESEHLFIGGPADGQMFDTHQEQFFRVIDRNSSYRRPDVVNYVTYEAKRFVENEDVFLIYVPQGDTGSVLKTLISGYHKKP